MVSRWLSEISQIVDCLKRSRVGRPLYKNVITCNNDEHTVQKKLPPLRSRSSYPVEISNELITSRTLHPMYTQYNYASGFEEGNRRTCFHLKEPYVIYANIQLSVLLNYWCVWNTRTFKQSQSYLRRCLPLGTWPMLMWESVQGEKNIPWSAFADDIRQSTKLLSLSSPD